MAGIITIPVVFDLLGGSAGPQNILEGVTNRFMAEESLVAVFLNRQDTDVTAQIKMASTEVHQLGPVKVNATAGDTPGKDPASMAWYGMGQIKDELQINGTNVNAAVRQLRATIFILPVRMLALLPQLTNVLS